MCCGMTGIGWFWKIWVEFQELGEESDFFAVATNLQRKYIHAEHADPDTPDTTAPKQ